MIKYLVIILFSISVCGSAFAECEQLAESDYSKHKLVLYNHTHDIYEPIEKHTKADDVLEVWDKHPQQLCFFATFVTNYYHMCFIGGKAVKSKSNEYIYSENNCKITLKFVKNKVRFTVNDVPDGNCSADDLSDQNRCGFNASIQSAIFTKESKAPTK
ncbi:MAG: hypothetical protein RBR35_18180 [Salinivirgaceae bacterium]|nr:hypothetical protein [Salinivirgaceae bacterium]